MVSPSPTDMPNQNHETQVMSETPMTIASGADQAANGLFGRVSQQELPLNELREANESAEEGGAGIDRMGYNAQRPGEQILVENNSGARNLSSMNLDHNQADSQSAAADMTDQKHTNEEKQLMEVEKLNDEAKF